MDRPLGVSDAPRRTHRVCVAAAVITLLPLQIAAVDVVDQSAAMAIRNFLAHPTTARQYSAMRRLEASGSGHRAWLDVQTDFTLASGLLYEVTAEGGSGYIRARVLRLLLEEERRLIARGGGPGIAITTDNYQFTPEGINEEGLAVVSMRPLRKDRSLIAGRMFVTVDGELRRVEGRLAKNPSFWVTRVNIVRSYRRINGVLMPVSLETTAQLRLLGASELRMTYRYSRIDERPVQDEERDSRQDEDRSHAMGSPDNGAGGWSPPRAAPGAGRVTAGVIPDFSALRASPIAARIGTLRRRQDLGRTATWTETRNVLGETGTRRLGERSTPRTE
jgi:hypothetical protein